MKLERITIGPLTVLAGGEGPPLLYLGGLLPVAGVDSSLARRTAEFSVGPFRTSARSSTRTGGRGCHGNDDRCACRRARRDDQRARLRFGRRARRLDGRQHRAATCRRAPGGGTAPRSSEHRLPPFAEGTAHAGSGRTTRAGGEQPTGTRVGDGRRPARRRADGVPAHSAPVAVCKRVGDLSDLATTIEAEDGFDLARCERTITAPTLIIAGDRDRFYPGWLLDETGQLIPGSILQRVPRHGHLTVMTTPRLVPIVRAHLQE